jgi:Rrf2 family protein
MVFSKRTTYGLRALIHLVPLYPDGYSAVSAIAEKEKISKRFLDQLFSQLNRANIVQSKKGKYGGFYLQREPGAILLSDIVEAFEGPLAVAECGNKYAKCAIRGHCKVNLLIDDLQMMLKKYLGSITLKGLSERIPENAHNYII